MFHPHGRISRLLAAGLLAIPIGALGQSSSNLPPLPEDLIPELRPVLVSALAQSPQMIARNIDIAQAEGNRISDAAAMLPSLGTNVQYGSNTTTTAYAASNSSTNSGLLYSISANQPIYHWGALKARSDIGKIGVQIAERNYADAYRQLIVSTRAQFLALVAKKIGLRNAEYALQQAERALAFAEDQVKAKTLPPGAAAAPQMAVDDALLARDRVVEDIENSKRLFALSIGQADFGTQNIPDEVPRPAYAPEIVTKLAQRLVDEGGEETYPIANLRDSIKQADLDYRIARVQLRPMFGLSYYNSQQTQANVVPGTVNQYVTKSNNYNVVANWSVFDGFATRGAKLSALSRKHSLERTLHTTVDQTIAQVRDLEKQLGFSWRGLDLTQRRRDLAENAVAAITADVKRGLLSENDINATRSNLYQSDWALAVARSDFFNLWSQFVSTLCIDPMLDVIPNRYLQNGK